MRILSAALTLLVLGTTQTLRGGEPTPGTAAPMEYVLEDLQGNVQVREGGTSTWTRAEEGQVLEAGDQVRTGDGSQAALSLAGETNLQLGPKGDLTVEEIANNGQGGFVSRLKLLTGRFLADVKKNIAANRSTFEVEANGVVCGVRGTVFEIMADPDHFDLSVHEGGVQVQEGKNPRLVKSGQAASYRLGRFLLLRKLGRHEGARFQEWRKFRRTVLLKRTQRLEDVRKNIRKPWKRRHPRSKKAVLQRNLLRDHR
jgi:ferric-dicitrate binding protein FerR (iron transport regulator)